MTVSPEPVHTAALPTGGEDVPIAALPQDMPLTTLIENCRRETARYLRREPSRDQFCCEIFRRAICDRDETAWGALYAEYRGLVVSWVRRHPAFSVAREDPEYWANRAFERFWRALNSERFPSFPNVAALLRYLQLCVHSVLQDEARQQGASRIETVSVERADAFVASADAETVTLGTLAGHDLWQAIQREVQDEAEGHVAYLCLVLNFKPQEVYQRHADRYASVADVYRVKRNLLDRLRRSDTIRHFLIPVPENPPPSR